MQQCVLPLQAEIKPIGPALSEFDSVKRSFQNLSEHVSNMRAHIEAWVETKIVPIDSTLENHESRLKELSAQNTHRIADIQELQKLQVLFFSFYVCYNVI
jgi:hypothetical protein